MMSIWIPFIGTVLGASCVYIFKEKENEMLSRSFSGIAAGVMVSASIFSLLLPALEQSHFLMVVLGIWVGAILMWSLDHFIPHVHFEQEEGKPNHLSRVTKLVLAMVLHNIPEGMAVGIVYASGYKPASIALAIGIALQNFPEGAILSLPFQKYVSKHKAFLIGSLSGIVEPLASLVTIYFSKYLGNYIPFLLSMASGAMLYVVIEKLIPEMAQGKHSNIPTIMFMMGFSLMLVLDQLF